MANKYDSSQIAPSWLYCFNAQCPMHDNCLRFQSALEMPADKENGCAVYPMQSRTDSADSIVRTRRLHLLQDSW